jgi:2-amino-4-hydroxy-6-hydroxymethyldihydropteridine diphosphokinase
MRGNVTECALSLGSNVGDRLANIRRAVGMIGEICVVTAKSPVYETPPWGFEAQPRFLNACVAAETGMTPSALLAEMKKIEAAAGRVERERWGPRELDIDILFYGRETVNENGLVIPHPRTRERAFVLVPLRDITPGFVHPVTGETIDEMLALTDSSGIVRIVQL